ncbi:hypothetical protein DLM78_16325 [Leptospira stimsonii]|uniref:Uncharacterized protein n=1 Tax=Leptospira stimsonii TaxID=2202203 RepID=A0A8B3CMV4_9LEPT|nr:hypothetical protein DLM78_16325 [Leptospira stimsonii]
MPESKAKRIVKKQMPNIVAFLKYSPRGARNYMQKIEWTTRRKKISENSVLTWKNGMVVRNQANRFRSIGP